jgi:hypothetical protein
VINQTLLANGGFSSTIKRGIGPSSATYFCVIAHFLNEVIHPNLCFRSKCGDLSDYSPCLPEIAFRLPIQVDVVGRAVQLIVQVGIKKNFE